MHRPHYRMGYSGYNLHELAIPIYDVSLKPYSVLIPSPLLQSTSLTTMNGTRDSSPVVCNHKYMYDGRLLRSTRVGRK